METELMNYPELGTKILFTVRETAEILGLSVEQVRRFIEDGQLTRRRVGDRGRYYVTRESLSRFIRDGGEAR